MAILSYKTEKSKKQERHMPESWVLYIIYVLALFAALLVIGAIEGGLFS
jgi:hypothetical protein